MVPLVPAEDDSRGLDRRVHLANGAQGEDVRHPHEANGSDRRCGGGNSVAAIHRTYGTKYNVSELLNVRSCHWKSEENVPIRK